ncbi:hypothetical protein GQ42DRAFT_161361 [Ramicandelaber brevisporus]|nr:hypothetical protein GQ42DRAFT_161361 [Ramicandelaber brevisporus]
MSNPEALAKLKTATKVGSRRIAKAPVKSKPQDATTKKILTEVSKLRPTKVPSTQSVIITKTDGSVVMFKQNPTLQITKEQNILVVNGTPTKYSKNSTEAKAVTARGPRALDPAAGLPNLGGAGPGGQPDMQQLMQLINSLSKNGNVDPSALANMMSQAGLGGGLGGNPADALAGLEGDDIPDLVDAE